MRRAGFLSALVYFAFQVVFSKFEDLLPKHLTEDDPELQLPTEEEIEEVSI